MGLVGSHWARVPPSITRPGGCVWAARPPCAPPLRLRPPRARPPPPHCLPCPARPAAFPLVQLQYLKTSKVSPQVAHSARSSPGLPLPHPAPPPRQHLLNVRPLPLSHLAQILRRRRAARSQVLAASPAQTAGGQLDHLAGARTPDEQRERRERSSSRGRGRGQTEQALGGGRHDQLHGARAACRAGSSGRWGWEVPCRSARCPPRPSC